MTADEAVRCIESGQRVFITGNCSVPEQLQDALDRATGKIIPWTTWDTYYLTHIYQISFERCVEAFIESKLLERAEPEPLAAETLLTLRANGWRIAIVTARGWHPDGEAVTRGWLARHGFPYDELHLVGHGDSKGAVFAGIGRIDLLVDDAPHHVLAAAELPTVRRPLIMTRPWNCDFRHPRVGRVTKPADVLDVAQSLALA